MKQTAKLLLIGWVVLVAAMLFNGLASLLGLSGWYQFFSGESISIFSWIIMIFAYPLLLGAAAYGAVKLFDKEQS